MARFATNRLIAAAEVATWRGEDPLFRKGAQWITPLVKPPFRALDLRMSASPYPFFTLGDLRTDSSGGC